MPDTRTDRSLPPDRAPAAASHDAPYRSALATAACAAATLLGWAIAPGPASIACFAVAYLAGGSATAVVAIRELVRGRLNIDLLMIAAAAGAAFLGQWTEGAVLLFLFSLSHTLEAYAMYRTTRSIDALLQLRPGEATLVIDGQEQRVPIERLEIGNLVRVRPGERFPVDGQVLEGETWADESTLTGESEPIAKEIDDPVFAGTINGAGSVLVRMTRGVADTTLERIVRMVREAQASQTPTQRFVESWQGPYAAFVLSASLLVFLGAWTFHDQRFGDAFYHAMVLLVVMSPCAVVIGSPAVTLSAIARAARGGVLFKGGGYLEILGEVDVIAFDKTGTITHGRPVVTEVWADEGASADQIVGWAAAVEQRSEHPLAAAVVAEAARRGVSVSGDLAEFHSHSGQGIHAHVGGTWIGVGREGLFDSHGLRLPDSVREAARQFRDRGQTALLVSATRDGAIHGGVIAVADEPRAQAREALRALRRLGVRRTVILTGDHDRVARAIAERVGAVEVRSGLLPEEKVVELRRLKGPGGRVAMVGDGVNDAPALATADVGIAMGGRGTDVALEVADVVLMSDDLGALPFAVWLSRQARLRIRQNLLIAFSMIGALTLASFFELRLWLGVLGHEGSTVVVVLNGLRLLWDRPPANLMREPAGPNRVANGPVAPETAPGPGTGRDDDRSGATVS